MSEEKYIGLVDLARDLMNITPSHIVLGDYEFTAININKITSRVVLELFSNEIRDGTVHASFKSIKTDTIALFIEVLVFSHQLGVDAIHLDKKPIKDFKEMYGLPMVNALVSASGVLIEGITVRDASLMATALAIINTFIYSLLELYENEVAAFYDDVEAEIFAKLAEGTEEKDTLSMNKLNSTFKGKTKIALSVIIDKKDMEPFKGFLVSTDKESPAVFSASSPYKAFLAASQYIHTYTKFIGVKFIINSETKLFLNMYSIAFVNEDMFSQEMGKGAYPILVPKGAENMDEFLEALIK